MSESNFLKELGHIIVGGYYDHQAVRTQTMNRIRDVIRKRNEGIPMNAIEEKKEKKTYDKRYSDKWLPLLLDEMKKSNKLTEEEYEYITKLLEAEKKAHAYEQAYKPLMEEYIKTEPLYIKWLSKIKGIGPVLSANLIHHFGYCDGRYPDGRERVPHVSSLWRYAGMHVVNGKAPKRQKGQKLDYNTKARTLVWKIADSFIKQRTSPYREIYDSEKKRQLALMEAKAPNAPSSALHADLRARRRVAKIFLSHYWLVARQIRGLPVTKPYAFDKLSHTNMILPPGWDEKNE